MATDPSVGIAVLDADACYDLLRSEEVGRLAVAVGHYPDIFPINYVLDGDTIVFCTAEGTKLAAAIIGQFVAFEIDGYDAPSGDAWSVVVKARADEIAMQELPDATAFPLHPWSGTPKPRFVRLALDEVTGRRFRVVDRRAAHSI